MWCASGATSATSLNLVPGIVYRSCESHITPSHPCSDPLPIRSLYLLGSDLCQGWNDSFFQAIGLQELVDSGYHVIGSEVATPGQPVGRGLARGVASELGLLPGTSVATAIIDAHAGGLGQCVGVWLVKVIT